MQIGLLFSLNSNEKANDMTYFKALCYFIGVVQLILGALYLFAPQYFVGWQGLSEIGHDINYPLGMLAARFIVYGVGMFVIASDPLRYRIWADGMIAIQAIDLAAGVFYTGTGVVDITHSGFPMFNAAMFIIGLTLLRRHVPDQAAA